MPNVRALAKALVHAVIVLVGVLAISFVLVRLTGDPATLMLGPEASPADIAELRSELGLDDPLPVQFVAYLSGVVQGDFGTSLRYHRPAFELVVERLPATLELTVAAMALALLVAVPAGMAAGYLRGSRLDHVAMFGAVVGQSMPGFWVGLMLILIFPVSLGVLYTSGRGTLEHLILPAVTLSLFSLAQLTRLARSTTLEILHQDYIRTALGKGLAATAVVRRHVLRNIMIPIASLTGVQLATMLGGAVVTETVFAWPGVGHLAITAVAARDYPVIQATVVVVATGVVLVNFVVDATYGVIDPRLRAR